MGVAKNYLTNQEIFMAKYFRFQNNIEEMKLALAPGQKLLIGGKMLLKGVANIGIFAVTEMPVEMAKQILKMENASDEQKENARRAIERYKNK